MTEHAFTVGGRSSALRLRERLEAAINRIALWTISHPTFGLPRREHRLAAVSQPSTTKASAA